MFQRSTPRQAGFIRSRNYQHRVAMNSIIDLDINGMDSAYFSPFKDSSPEPLQCIIQSYRQQQRPARKQNNLNQINSRSLAKESKRQDFSNLRQKERVFDHHRSSFSHLSSQVTEQSQEVQVINAAPRTLDLSLAEAFESKCRRIKQKLEYERNKFSKSKSKYRKSESVQDISECCQVIDLRPKKSDNHPDRTKRNRRRERNEDKQNCQSFANMVQPTTLKKTVFSQPKVQKSISIEPINTSVKFFVPAPTSRSKPITPREAYQHSLKKWKQLPEVVAREKEREKERNMKERITKMRAHSMQVRKKMRR